MCTVDGTKHSVKLPLYTKYLAQGIMAWKTSHFVKHVIMELHLEVHAVLGISSETIQEVHNKLMNDLDCSLMRDKNSLDNEKISVCAGCTSLKECSNEFSSYHDLFVEYLSQAIRNDIKNPRHIYYDKTRDKRNLAFVNDAGVIVLTKHSKNNIILKSGFRPYDNAANEGIMASELKKKYPDLYYLHRARTIINQRVKNGMYFNTKKILEKNW